ncbi:hypothetical protein EVAR_75086_1 [Eumeta japonica]|uniref:Uncharacterized protein n=1 Tax=Eumeta variegata TaxID=151549 RepID=A0A4C1W2C3_EUMVA|nr:hypothetical protein EVAR_75086_1 [Eumeta japonica]
MPNRTELYIEWYILSATHRVQAGTYRRAAPPDNGHAFVLSSKAQWHLPVSIQEYIFLNSYERLWMHLPQRCYVFQ